mmetsp:Transcript_79004/g.123303  ORF Transcript_79004/g.123303 Transcript_79004/m.123303 type:complete len:517 (+) Transcript_79004:85-1635(+)|eukprot:CAMPEP_0169071736 /NCGR_PEP_ID=MMETSP1015-20121227/5813_1 /TAXON_ID=342587 /ORGANISM="Karlodinium micrum, Strain CCMP2283" /LENGTH=516 /DNA_ID=CAMNT_0009130831 /DNA_START=88 /DNA_END=1638 /DNA_ORIENTATION=+
MDDDSEIDGFLDSFLGETQAPRKPRVRHCTEQLRSGLALHVQAGQVVRKKPSSRRDVVFHKLLEDMANDLMENGTCARSCSREVSPRSPRDSPVLERASSSTDPAPLFPTSPSKDSDEDPPTKEEAETKDEAEEASSEESESDVGSGRELQPESPQPHFRLQDFGGARASKHISVSVVLDTGAFVLKDYSFERDSPLVDLFTRVEEEACKEVHALIGPHGENLERAELPIKWSGLRDGDVITLVHHKHPKLEERRIDLAVSPTSGNTRILPPVRTCGLSKAWKTMDFPDQGPVSMGGFADTIVGVQDTRASDINQPTSNSARPGHWSGTLDAKVGSLESEFFDKAELPSHWLSMGVQNAENAEIVHISNGSKQIPSVPMPPDVAADEFELLPADAWTTPPHQNHNDQSLETAEKGCIEEMPHKMKSPFPSRPSHNADSPVPSRVTATPTKSIYDSVTSTPSRRTFGPPKMQRLDADSVKKRQEEMQKRSDAIWANIAATLEPAPSALGTKKLLRQR